MKHSIETSNGLILAQDRGDGWNEFQFSIFSKEGRRIAKGNLEGFVFLPKDSTISTPRDNGTKASGMAFVNPFRYEIVADVEGRTYEMFSDNQYSLLLEVETRNTPTKIVEVVSKPLPNGGGKYLSASVIAHHSDLIDKQIIELIWANRIATPTQEAEKHYIDEARRTGGIWKWVDYSQKIGHLTDIYTGQPKIMIICVLKEYYNNMGSIMEKSHYYGTEQMCQNYIAGGGVNKDATISIETFRTSKANNFDDFLFEIMWLNKDNKAIPKPQTN